MQFLKILFWCLLAFLAAVFTIGNWRTVDIHLWGGLIADVNLPLLLLTMFLIGFLPTYLYFHAVRWRLRQRLATSERAQFVPPTPPVAPTLTPAPYPAPTVTPLEPDGPLPPAAAPTAVPPGVA